jgi:hypothetical protein
VLTDFVGRFGAIHAAASFVFQYLSSQLSEHFVAYANQSKHPRAASGIMEGDPWYNNQPRSLEIPLNAVHAYPDLEDSQSRDAR